MEQSNLNKQLWTRLEDDGCSKKKTNKTKNRKEQRERDGMVSQVAGLKGPVGANLERS